MKNEPKSLIGKEIEEYKQEVKTKLEKDNKSTETMMWALLCTLFATLGFFSGAFFMTIIIAIQQ